MCSTVPLTVSPTLTAGAAAAVFSAICGFDLQKYVFKKADKIFFRLLNGDRPYFSLKLVYDGDTLKQAVLDGKQIV